MSLQSKLEKVIERKRVTEIEGYAVITDQLDYTAIDQVFPIYPEQAFFLDELDREKIKGAHALEVGVGSGVLSIGVARAGAAKVTALEINPRAKNTAGFNIVMNGLEDRIAIIDGKRDIFSPVVGQSFDYIFSNPPFEPTPPEQDFFYHSAAGPFGLDFIETLFQGVNEVLKPGGHLQIVTAAPGDDKGPFMFADLAREYLRGTTQIVVSPVSLDYFEAVDWLPEKGFFTYEQAENLKHLAHEAGVTRSFLCVLHHIKDDGGGDIQIMPASKVYASPEIPFE